ncbi:MAG TPA: RNA polymerase sigma factor [Ktedonobacterales bacterium]|nr:RNA polymerase sigma factor [Ktedonobacterales bacterium]
MLQIRLTERRSGWRSACASVPGWERMARLWLPGQLALGRTDGASGSTSRAGTAQAANARRQSVYEQWFAQYRLPLLDYLFGMTRDREWAADLVQETFLHAFAAAEEPDAIASPRAWLYRIATNVALSALRRRKRFTWLPLTVIEPEAGASSSDRWVRPELPDLPDHDFSVSVAERDAVWKTLAELPPRWRSVLLLQTTGGFEIREIATQLGLSEANVRKIIFRAKERFRALHAQHEEADQTRPARGGSR